MDRVLVHAVTRFAKVGNVFTVHDALQFTNQASCMSNQKNYIR